MAHDYKNRSSRKGDAGGGRLTTLLTFFAGAVTGLCAAIIIYLVDGIPALDGMLDTRRPVVTMPSDTAETPATKSTEEAEQSATPTPKFDFYTILPEMEVSVPEWESETEVADPVNSDDETEPQQTVSEDQHYILQVGSFRQPDEAERVRAELALLGIEAQIQRVVIDGGDVWHRVRAGPYQSTAKLDQTRQRLIKNDIDFMLLKLKQDSG